MSRRTGTRAQAETLTGQVFPKIVLNLIEVDIKGDDTVPGNQVPHRLKAHTDNSFRM